jgi:outer membrane protein assembly factor BamD (BamD/ComL family)
VKITLALMVLIALAGCATLKPKTKADNEFQIAAVAVKEKRYEEAVTLYRKILSESLQPASTADALFQLAYLQTLYDNPQKDYAKSIQSFDEFIKRYPGHARYQEAENWRFILRTILDLRKENDRLHNNIEQLRKLDIRHEENRERK